MSERKQLRAIVHGLVQGVGFRWSTRQMARRLGLRGYVRNRRDRTVEVVAEGPERTLREFLSYLQTGPSGAIVDGVDAKWLPDRGRYHGFEVRF
jgi:acylphosphatase